MRKAISTPLAVVIIIVVLVAAVAGTYYFAKSAPSAPVSTTTSVATTSSVSGGTVVLEVPTGPDTFDPDRSYNTIGLECRDNVYQTLLITPFNSTQILPFLAENYSISPDGLTYTVWLRQNVTFSNGDPFNAYVVWYGYYRGALVHGSDAGLILQALNMTGVTADELNTFTSSDNVPPASLLQIMEDPKLAVTVINPYEVDFHLSYPFGVFLTILAQTYEFVDPNVVSAHGGVVANEPNTWLDTHAIGTGPFMITEYEPNSMVVFERNPKYWGGASGVQLTPRIDKVIMEVVPNSLTRLEDVERGSAQAAYVDFSQAPQLAGAAGIYVPNFGAIPITEEVALNTQKFPFNNLLIRQAVSHAINSTELLQPYVGFGLNFVGPIPKGMLGYNNSLQPPTYDLALAKQLLAKAGYPNGHGIPPLTMIYPTDIPPSSLEVELIQTSLAQIGITVKLTGVSETQLFAVISGNAPNSTGHPELIYDQWYWFPDPWAYATWLVGPLDYETSNEAIYMNPTVDALLHNASASSDRATRALIYEHIQSIVYSDVPYIWVGQSRNAMAAGIPVMSVSLRGTTGNTPLTIQTKFFDYSTFYLLPSS